MINKKEIFIILIIILIIAFSINLSLNLIEWRTFLLILGTVAIIMFANIFTKKITAYLYDTEIEMKIWEINRRPFSGRLLWKKPLLIGAFLPIISKAILFPINSLVWMASLVFDVKPRIYSGAKRHGLYTFSEITEWHLGVIASSGIIVNLILSVIGYLLGFSLFSRLNIYFAFFNILPLSELDGNKIFFGSKVLWSFLASLVLIGMLFALFIV